MLARGSPQRLHRDGTSLSFQRAEPATCRAQARADGVPGLPSCQDSHHLHLQHRAGHRGVGADGETEARSGGPGENQRGDQRPSPVFTWHLPPRLGSPKS